MKIYQWIADFCVAEGCRDLFTLMGDGNMHFTIAFQERDKTRAIYLRHEHSAVAAASAYARARQEVGLASVTYGPGLTQLGTALVTAVKARIPLVIVAGETPIGKAWDEQQMDQAPFVTATGAIYIAAHCMERLPDHVRDAFYLARTERRPVVLAIPYDMQKRSISFEKGYVPSSEYIPVIAPIVPDQTTLTELVDALALSKKSLIIGGRGVYLSNAAEDCIALADHTGSLIGTTLPVRGMFEQTPRSIGIAGGYSPDRIRELLAECDLVVGIGCSLTHHTLDGGKLFPNAKIIQVSNEIQGIKQGRRTADSYILGDAKATITALLKTISDSGRNFAGSWPEVDYRTVADEEALETVPDYIHPSIAVATLNNEIPEDWAIVAGAGHNSYFTAQMRGRTAHNFLTIREFGAIGNGLAYSIGMAVAHPDKKVVVFDGDGSIYMHIQELDTIRRHELNIMVCVMNDGAYGPEIHKLGAEGLDYSGSTFGRHNMGMIARGFGLGGSSASTVEEIQAGVKEFNAADRGYLLDVRISEKVASPFMRRGIQKHLAV